MIAADFRVNGKIISRICIAFFSVVWWSAVAASAVAETAPENEDIRAVYARLALPDPDIFEMIPMRDGVRLATYILLPQGEGPFPTVLTRSAYKEGIIPWGRYGHQRFLDAGYAVAWQSTRGTGKSEGVFRFVSDDRADGYDAIEWIADQSWSNGKVAMDGGSYLGVTQLQAAAAAPPSLKAIMPAVPESDFFRSVPYWGGIFRRMHTLNWLKLMSVDHWADLETGFMNPSLMLENEAWLARLRRTPVIDAADGFLEGDRLAVYRDHLENPTLNEYFQAIQNMPEDYAKMDVPMLMITGNFDPSVGALYAWEQIEKYAPAPQQRHMLIGPWTHSETREGNVRSNNFYDFGDTALVDLWALKIAFLDRYLKGVPPSEPLPQRVRVFITGANEWRSFDSIPVPERTDVKLYLQSNGSANTYQGDGKLSFSGPEGAPDKAIADPENPIIDKGQDFADAVAVTSRSDRNHEGMLVYLSAPFESATTIVGESSLTLSVAIDTPDADIIAYIDQVYEDGTVVSLGRGGGLRLRYYKGYDRERTLKPGKLYEIEIPLSYVGHEISAGSRIQLTIMGTSFPVLDPNPNTGEPIATATKMQPSTLTVYHDEGRPSYLTLPTVE